MAFSAEQLTQEQIAELKETFNLFDKDGDGHITVSELMESCQQMGLSITESEAKQMSDEVDDDRNGTLDFAEFLQYITIQMKDAETNDEVMKLAYQEFDRGNKGHISAEDVHRMMGILEEDITLQEVVEILKECDQDGDGQIDFYALLVAIITTSSLMMPQAYISKDANKDEKQFKSIILSR